MWTFIALVVAVIAIFMAKRARDEVEALRKQVLGEAAPLPPPVPKPKPAPAPEPVIPIYQPPAPSGATASSAAEGSIPLTTPAFSVAEAATAPPPSVGTPSAPAVEAPAAPPVNVRVEPAERPPLPPPRTPHVPLPPPQPPVWQRIDWESLVGVKLFSWIAGIALVVAAIYFLKYSVEHGWISPPIRAAIGLVTGSALLVICELRVARNYRFTANAMLGAGIAILYATLFAVHALWHLLPAVAVFGGMIVVTAVAVLLSIRRDSLFIALLGMLGGFATPALLSTGENRPIALFSYLLLLNAGLAFVAYRKRWPALTVGTVLFSVIYQWAWIGKFLDAAQLPLAAAIFVAFALAAAAVLWMRRDDAQQKLFDHAAKFGVAMPVLFALFTAAVPAYGARFHVLFAFLLLMAAGLGVIAMVRDAGWLHALGLVATALTFVIWLIVSYTPEAWPPVIAWASAFVLLYLGLGLRYRSRVVIGAGVLLFIFAMLTAIEPRAASPTLLFGALFVLLLLTGAYAVKFREHAVFLAGTFFAVMAQVVWSAKHLSEERLFAGLTTYGAFGLLLLAVPVFARRLGRFDGAPHLALTAHALLLFVVASPTLSLPPWPFLAVLFVLDLAIGVAALWLRRGSLLAGSAVMSQVLLLVWSAHVDAAPWADVALACTVGVAAYATLWFVLARRLTESVTFARAAAAALFLGHFVAIVAGTQSDVPLFGTLLAAHALLVAGTLLLAAAAELHVLAVLSVPIAAIATAFARPETPGHQFTFALVLYTLFIAYPLFLGRRVKRALEPHLAAVMASVPFFFFAREAMKDAGLESMIGILPVAQALVLLIVLVRLRQTEPAEERSLTRLALVAAAALAFLTAAIPLQLEKQWVTIGWALEGAALVWLLRRIPHRGLLAWAAALLAAAFVRLTINPEILGYYPPSERAIVNWYLYTYLVCAAAFFAAAHLAPKAYKVAIGLTRAAGTLLLFFLLNIEIADYFSTGPTLTFNFLSSSLAQDLTYTMGWASFAIVLLVAGIAFHTRAARVAAIALLVITIFKCFLHDLARLGGLYRIASFLGLALALVMVSVLLQKFVLSRRVAEPEASS
jgi:hypothetical protein